MTIFEETRDFPGADLDLSRMPGHWLLARMGKRVLRPGGLELTRRMLEGLAITASDRVVELAPGLGTTAGLALQREPASYVGVERDPAAVAATQRLLRAGRDECRQGVASRTGLDSSSATVMYGEAMLTMQTATQKEGIVQEAFRLLRPGGRYGIHELALTPDNLSDAEKNEVMRELSAVIHVGARPLTVSEWRTVIEGAGFEIVEASTAPMHLLEPMRVLRDEGPTGVLRIAFNLARTPVARRRVLAMRAVFRKFEDQMCAVMLIARKPEGDASK